MNPDQAKAAVVVECVMVPREPTPEMLAAFLDCQPLTAENKSTRMWQLFLHSDHVPEWFREIVAHGVRAMLSAAPPQATASEGETK